MSCKEKIVFLVKAIKITVKFKTYFIPAHTYSFDISVTFVIFICNFVIYQENCTLVVIVTLLTYRSDRDIL